MAAITGARDEIPSDREVMHYLMDTWKSNVEFGRFVFHLIHCGPIRRTEFPARFNSTAIEKTLSKLGRREAFYRVAAEGRVHGVPGKPIRGCIVLGHTRPSGEPGYYAAVFDERFLHACSFQSIVPAGKNNPSRLEVLTSTGWKHVSSRTASDMAEMRIVMTALSKEVDAADGGQFNRKNLLQDPALTPPTDPEYMRRISETIRKRMRITRGVAKLSQVVAHNLEFCIGLPHKDIRSLTQRIIRGYRPELTVYWRNEHFVMSDDYFAFLAYRQAGVTSVPLAILGCFPPRAAETIARGGIELLPPIEVMLGSVSTSRSAALEEWLANHRANAKGRRAKPADLAAAWLVFADHIAHSETTEADVHKYLLQFPVIIATGGKAVESEVWLGKTYKMDLVVRYTGVIEEALLIELENPQHFIFTRNGRPRKAVTHARQQVEDWLRWVRENPADAFVQTLAGVPPKGLVVIGKSRNLSNDERRRLAHLNIGGNVAIVTYDQLLERFGDLILQQCDDTRD